MALVSALVGACVIGDERPTCESDLDCAGALVCDCPRDTKCTDPNTGAPVMYCYMLCDTANGCPTGKPCMAGGDYPSICDPPPEPVEKGEPPPPEPPF